MKCKETFSIWFIYIIFYFQHFSQVKMINKEVTVSVQLTDINYIISLEHEEMGCDYSKLTKGTDYEVHKDVTSLFIKITKQLDCEKEHHLKLTLNQSVDGTDVQWIIHFQPNGKNLVSKQFFM